MAYKLEGSEVWDFGLSAFLGKETQQVSRWPLPAEPYRPGKIPVVFVHGTASSPVWWAEMFNTLRFDPLIRQKYQFWYLRLHQQQADCHLRCRPAGRPARESGQLDPQGKDPALQQMVVIGHSQGGLLTKLTAVDTGDSLVRAMTGKDLDSLEMPEESKAKVRRLLMSSRSPS